MQNLILMGVKGSNFFDPRPSMSTNCKNKSVLWISHPKIEFAFHLEFPGNLFYLGVKQSPECTIPQFVVLGGFGWQNFLPPTHYKIKFGTILAQGTFYHTQVFFGCLRNLLSTLLTVVNTENPFFTFGISVRSMRADFFSLPVWTFF